MRSSFLPAGGDETASSRIRVFSLEAPLARRGWSTTIGFDPDSEVVVVQKKVTDRILGTAREAKAAGTALVYDVDDLGSALDYWTSPADLDAMLDLADLVITDTAGHREQLVRDYGARSVEIMPDCIDYYPTGPSDPADPNAASLRVMWFGSIGNIGLFQRYADRLLGLEGVEVVVVTGAASAPDYAARHPRITVVPWSRSDFVDVLQSCHLTCLMHDGSEIDRAKSNNRMITSISWGVPALVSRTPEYERTAREASVEDAVFEDERELAAVVDRFRTTGARLGYLARAQGRVWARYCPDAVAHRFCSVMESLVCELRT